MATWNDVRTIALALPATHETTSYGKSAWAVRGKTFAWERPLGRADVAALGAEAPGGAILAVRTADLEMKEALIASDPAVFFTTPHFHGYAAVLVVLASIKKSALRRVLVDGWLSRAPERIASAYLAERPAPRRTSARARDAT